MQTIGKNFFSSSSLFLSPPPVSTHTELKNQINFQSRIDYTVSHAKNLEINTVVQLMNLFISKFIAKFIYTRTTVADVISRDRYSSRQYIRGKIIDRKEVG
jgi:hypothetical protein